MISARHINPPLKAILSTIMRIDAAAVSAIPMQGPLILATNHINWLDAPVGFSYLHPRPVTAFAKIETWNNFLMRTLFNAWEAIPITRGQVDFTAFRKAEEALANGKIIVIAPEGTRSHTGELNQGYPGIVYLALRTGVPIMPFVVYGNENFSRDIRQYRRTQMNLRAGKPFRLLPTNPNPDRQTRQDLTDAIMYEIAGLLPQNYRGKYANMDSSYQRHLEFLNLST
jgi:1-acyl-sn-glycerol-3-phosphate acyltransferase